MARAELRHSQRGRPFDIRQTPTAERTSRCHTAVELSKPASSNQRKDLPRRPASQRADQSRRWTSESLNSGLCRHSGRDRPFQLIIFQGPNFSGFQRTSQIVQRETISANRTGSGREIRLPFGNCHRHRRSSPPSCQSRRRLLFGGHPAMDRCSVREACPIVQKG